MLNNSPVAPKTVAVLGAGIVGLTLATTLQQAGHEVTLVSAMRHRASSVPHALLNPVRGKRATIAPDATAALEAVWRFYPRYTQLHRGVWRKVPEALLDTWCQRLAAAGVAYSLHPAAGSPAGACLLIEDAAWLHTAPLLERLLLGLRVVEADIGSIEVGEVHHSQGITRADVVVAALGAMGGGLLAPYTAPGRYTAGSVLQLQQYQAEAVSWGVYAAGHTLGGSYLPHSSSFVPHSITPQEQEQLTLEGEALLGSLQATGHWSGVRYRTNGQYIRPAPFGWVVNGLGSAGYFYAPLLAEQLLALV